MGSKVIADITATEIPSGTPPTDKDILAQQEEAENGVAVSKVREEVSGKRQIGEKRKKPKSNKKKEF